MIRGIDKAFEYFDNRLEKDFFSEEAKLNRAKKKLIDGVNDDIMLRYNLPTQYGMSLFCSYYSKNDFYYNLKVPYVIKKYKCVYVDLFPSLGKDLLIDGIYNILEISNLNIKYTVGNLNICHFNKRLIGLVNNEIVFIFIVTKNNNLHGVSLDNNIITFKFDSNYEFSIFADDFSFLTGDGISDTRSERSV